MNFYREIENNIRLIIKDLDFAQDHPKTLFDGLNVERVKNIKHGDLATNIAMIMSGKIKKPAKEIAKKISKSLEKIKGVDSVSIAGPGFINIKMKDDFWFKELVQILKKGEEYAKSKIGKRKKVNIEFVSANPTGPMHIGHARGAIIGDVLASMFENADYDVTREFYVNDAGSQINDLTHSVYYRYLESLGSKPKKFPKGFYPGKYLIKLAEMIKKKYGNQLKDVDKKAWFPKIKEFSIEYILDLIKADLSNLGITFDQFISEQSLLEKETVEKTMKMLKKKDLIYVGKLANPKGSSDEKWEQRSQLLFKSTRFGDDMDRTLKKQNGSWTYFASDISYHLDKYDRGFNKMINIWGVDHGGYVKRIKAAVKALTDGKGDLDILLCQLVKLKEGNNPLKMSKREGNFVGLDEVLKKVGKDVLRFIMLTRKNDVSLDFDFKKVTEKTKDNPVFYVQYAHARCNSVFRMAKEMLPSVDLSKEELIKAKHNLLKNDIEISLIKLLAEWPNILEKSRKMLEPHRCVFFLNDLASLFHSFWSMGKDNEKLRFIIPGNIELTKARMSLIYGVMTIISSALKIFGVKPVKEMH